MRILFLSQHCDPEPFTRICPLARVLSERGHSVEVLTGFPNYPQGRLYPGYRQRFLQREDLGGVPVLRVPLFPDHSRSAIRRIVSGVSLSLSTTLWGLHYARRPEIVFCYGHPNIVWGARVLQWRFGIPWIYDVQDLWPDTILASGITPPRFLMKIIESYVNRLYCQAPGLTAISPGLREALIARGAAAECVWTVYNWADETRPLCVAREAALAKRWGLEGKFVVMYAGNLGLAQGLEAVLEAAALLAPRRPEVHIVFMGSGVKEPELKALAQRRQLPNVTFIPHQPPAEMGRYLGLADALLIHLLPHPLFDITIPSKTQDYLRSGKPIVMATRGDAAELVRRAGAGVLCEPGDAHSIAAAIEKMASLSPEQLHQMGQAGPAFYERELSLRLGAQRFEEIFQEVWERARAAKSPKKFMSKETWSPPV